MFLRVILVGFFMFSGNLWAENGLETLDLSQIGASQNSPSGSASPEQLRAIAAQLFKNKKHKGKSVDSLSQDELMIFLSEQMSNTQKAVEKRNELLNSIAND